MHVCECIQTRTIRQNKIMEFFPNQAEAANGADGCLQVVCIKLLCAAFTDGREGNFLYGSLGAR